MKELNDLSPWIHPKAQNWFYALFRKTNLAMVIDDELQKPVGGDFIGTNAHDPRIRNTARS